VESFEYFEPSDEEDEDDVGGLLSDEDGMDEDED
jgi:hypothetical protein